jgi:putative NIF3 family GTP cyclohydrolase 1 type 2
MAKLLEGHHDSEKIIKKITVRKLVKKTYQQIIFVIGLEHRYILQMGSSLGLST